MFARRTRILSKKSRSVKRQRTISKVCWESRQMSWKRTARRFERTNILRATSEPRHIFRSWTFLGNLLWKRKYRHWKLGLAETGSWKTSRARPPVIDALASPTSATSWFMTVKRADRPIRMQTPFLELIGMWETHGVNWDLRLTSLTVSQE